MSDKTAHYEELAKGIHERIPPLYDNLWSVRESLQSNIKDGDLDEFYEGAAGLTLEHKHLHALL